MEGVIKMYLEATGCECVDWIQLAQGMVKCQALTKMHA
jgi:hypothetical protein